MERPTDPVSTPAVPNPAAPLVMSSVDWMVPFPAIWITPVLTSAVASRHRIADAILLVPMKSALAFVLLTVSVPPTFRLLPPPPPMLCSVELQRAAAAERNVSADRLGCPGS